MPVYSIHQARTHFSALVRMVEHGETITITRGRIPVAVLTQVGVVAQPRQAKPPDDAWADAPHDHPTSAWTSFPWGGTIAGRADAEAAAPGGREAGPSAGDAALAARSADPATPPVV